jgi:hypothetical protein
MNAIVFLALWLQMSAQTMPCQSAKLYYGGVLVDEEPHCGLLNQVINMPTALDDITRQVFPDTIQTTDPPSKAVISWTSAEKPGAADETDGKPPKKWGNSGNGGGKVESACIRGDERKECAETWAKYDAEHAVDVPAVQVADEACENKPSMAGRDGHEIECSLEGKRYTCDPKSRILEHDENSPPKYWCRKVEF